MAIPDYQTLMLPVLQLAAKGEKRVRDIIEPIADMFSLTEEECERLLPSGRQPIIQNRIHWAKFYLMKAGFITFPSRGYFIATELGRNLLAQHPTRIDIPLLLNETRFRDFYQNKNTQNNDETIKEKDTDVESNSSSSTPEELIESASASINSALQAELIERISKNSPSFFEQLIINLLVAMGYGGSHKNAAAQLGRTGDGGVDGIINEDPLGLDRVYIQAKRYNVGNSIGRPEVQAFVGSLIGFGASKGVFVTTSFFSQHAKDFVKHLNQRIILIDGSHLTNLMVEYGVGVRTQRLIALKRLDEDFFTEE